MTQKKEVFKINTKVIYKNEVWTVANYKMDLDFRVIRRGDSEKTVHVSSLEGIKDESN